MTNRFCKTVAGVVGLGICSMSLPALAEPRILRRPAEFWRAQIGTDECRRGKEWRSRFQYVGDRGRERRHGVRRYVFGGCLHRSMARQPAHFGAEGRDRQRLKLEQGRTAQDRACSQKAWCCRPPTSTLRPNRAAVSTACSTAIRWTRRSPTQGSSTAFGTASDPLVGFRIGGVNVFGGGLGLYITGRHQDRRASGSAATPPAPTILSPGGFALS